MATRKNTFARRELLRRELAEACATGALAPGEMVPALGELTARYGLSNGVVHQEIKRLAAEGILYSVPRVGTFVAPRDEPVAARMGERDTIAVLTPAVLDLMDYWRPSGWANAVDQGATSAIHKSGFHVLSLHRTFFQNEAPTDGELDRLTAKGLFGLVVTDTEGMGETLRAGFQERGVPVVALDQNPKMGPCDRVVSDHEAGAYEMTRWLIQRGQRRIVNCWPLPSEGYWFPLRRRGYERAMEEAGLEALPTLLAPYRKMDSQAEFDAAARELAGYLAEYVLGAEPVDALFMASDGPTPATAAALRLLGKKPNEDVLLVGYDNYWSVMPYREFDATPPVVTVDKQNWRIGEEAVSLLLRRGRGELPAKWHESVVEPKIVVTEAGKGRFETN